MSIYCTYVTFYRGNKLPPFYIGSTSVKSINNGYHGSVSSREYKQVWASEIKNNPHLFITKILTTHNDRKAALEREEKLQRSLQVIKNSLYTNKSFATTGCFGDTMSGRKHSVETIRKITKGVSGKKRTPEQCERIGKSKRNRKQSAESNLMRSISQKGIPKAKHTAEQNAAQSKRQLGKRHKQESKIKCSESLRKYLYCTPFGSTDDPRNFKHIISYTTLRKWCVSSETTITLKNYAGSNWLQNNFSFIEVHGKTFKDLGFCRVLKCKL